MPSDPTSIAIAVRTEVANDRTTTPQPLNASGVTAAETAFAQDYELFADGIFGVSFSIPRGFEVRVDTSDSGPPTIRKVRSSRRSDGSSLFVFLQDDGPPTPIPPLVPTATLSPTRFPVDCEELRPAPRDSYATPEEYYESYAEFDACWADQHPESRYDYNDEPLLDPDFAYVDPTSVPTVDHKESVIAGGYPGLVEFLNHHYENVETGRPYTVMEYKFSAQYPDGLKLQVSLTGPENMAAELMYIISSLQLNR